MPGQISIEAFRELFETDSEFALIDAREVADFSDGHLLASSNLPLPELSHRISIAVPGRQTLCLLCDNGGGEAVKAGEQLASLGYTQVSILEGGLAAWRESGGQVFSGVSVPGKAFGEFIEKFCGTPSISANELRARQESDSRTLLIDSRSAEEHQSYCIPGAILCPGAELVYRLLPLAEQGFEIVVHCGGRTRSIIGAQTLIDAGCKQVYALENGTMAWQFEGYPLEQGSQREAKPPNEDGLPAIRAVAERMAERWYIDRIRSIPRHEQRSRYLIDVRSRTEFEAGHIAGSMHVPGGHLLQHVDRYLVVRNAVVVLIDSDGVRAVTTAVWLRRMGWRRVYVFSIDAELDALQQGPGPTDSPREDRDLDPGDFTDQAALMAQNRAYLEWEIGLIDQLPGDPAAPYYEPL